jgi:hypothetical protein
VESLQQQLVPTQFASIEDAVVQDEEDELVDSAGGGGEGQELNGLEVGED